MGMPVGAAIRWIHHSISYQESSYFLKRFNTKVSISRTIASVISNDIVRSSMN